MPCEFVYSYQSDHDTVHNGFFIPCIILPKVPITHRGYATFRDLLNLFIFFCACVNITSGNSRHFRKQGRNFLFGSFGSKNEGTKSGQDKVSSKYYSQHC